MEDVTGTLYPDVEVKIEPPDNWSDSSEQDFETGDTQGAVSLHVKQEVHEKPETVVKLENVKEEVKCGEAASITSLIAAHLLSENNRDAVTLQLKQEVDVEPEMVVKLENVKVEVKCELDPSITSVVIAHSLSEINRGTGDGNRLPHDTGQKRVIKYDCNQCNNFYYDRPTLSRHMLTHRSRYVCDVCGKRFSSRKHLRAHVGRHATKKPYPCSECDMRFPSTSNRNRHMRTHTGEKPYGCRECGRYFADTGTLGRHIQIHRGEKPYRCSQCGKTFRVKVHLHTCHIDGICLYVCGRCYNKIFRKSMRRL